MQGSCGATTMTQEMRGSSLVPLSIYERVSLRCGAPEFIMGTWQHSAWQHHCSLKAELFGLFDDPPSTGP